MGLPKPVILKKKHFPKLRTNWPKNPSRKNSQDKYIKILTKNDNNKDVCLGLEPSTAKIVGSYESTEL